LDWVPACPGWEDGCQSSYSRPCDRVPSDGGLRPAGSGVGRPPPVYPRGPRKLRAIYREIDGGDRPAAAARAIFPGVRRRPKTAFGVELLVANSNRGETLLNERVLQEAALTLDRLKTIGVQCVSLEPALSGSSLATTRGRPNIGIFTQGRRRNPQERIVGGRRNGIGPPGARVQPDRSRLPRFEAREIQLRTARDGRGDRCRHPGRSF